MSWNTKGQTCICKKELWAKTNEDKMIVVVQNINLLSATLRWLFYSLHHRQLQAASSLRNQQTYNGPTNQIRYR